ncbi:MAG: PEP-CTERM sorting domain-containing protein [Planctomycetota bacterium]
MSSRLIATKLVAACGLVLFAGVANAQRTFYVPGNFMSEAFGLADWSPELYSPAQAMMETGVDTGIYTLDFDLDYATLNNAGTLFNFKILEDLSGDGAQFGNADDPEITPNDSWFFGDADGVMSITLDTNEYDDGFFPTTNRVIVDSDIDTWNVIGDFQTQLGSLTDFNNSDPNTVMTDVGSGLFQLTATIPTPGAYSFRAVQSGSFIGIGTDQRRDDAANLAFNTFEDDQEVTFELDTTRGAIRFLTDAVLAGDTDNDGDVDFDDFTPIRDNFLTATSLRAEGDLDFSGFVDIRDFREWKNAFNGPPELIALAVSQLSAVPEPSSVLLLGVATLLGGFGRRNG